MVVDGQKQKRCYLKCLPPLPFSRLEFVLFSNAAHPAICEGWHFTHMWKTHA